MDELIIITKLFEAIEAERRAKNKRVELEAQLARAIEMPETWEGSMTNHVGDFKIKVSRKMNVKIDSDAVKGLMMESPQLEIFGKTVFRWKPEIDKKEWDSAPPEVIKAFSSAITRTPGKPSFSIELEKK